MTQATLFDSLASEPERWNYKFKNRPPWSVKAEANFRARLAELGAELLEPWHGALQKHAVRCKNGHLCHPKPASVQQGQGLCRTCVGQDPAASEANFRARIAELGATILGSYVDSATKIHVRDAAGHDCYPRPGQVQRGFGFCKKCARNDPEDCEARFLARVAELGAKPLYMAWEGSGKRHDVICAANHIASPRPSDVLQGGGVCPVCSRKSTVAAEAAFRARLEELGATLLDPWHGADAPHRVRCSRGHIGKPRPTNVITGGGGGVCRICKNMVWDAFYVVASTTGVKFGVTSGDGHRRLTKHARVSGGSFTEVLLLKTGLPGTVAPDAEAAVIAALALAREKPVRGREYFDVSCAALILDVAASWLGAAA